MTLLAFDPARLDGLRLALGAALDDLSRVRNNDLAAAEAMRTLRSASRLIGDVWLPRIRGVLDSKSMSTPTRTKLRDEIGNSVSYPVGSGPAWQLTLDPGGRRSHDAGDHALMAGPRLPGSRSFGEVVAAIMSGELVPMTAPVDAHGRAGQRYSSIAFAAASQTEVGHTDLTSSMLKFIDIASDGLPIGWRETRGMTIFYLKDARAVSTVHVLTAYDRKAGPDTLSELTTEATVSGYLVVKQDSSTAEVNVQIGSGPQDPTETFPIISQSSSAYNGVFYPDTPADFEPITHEPRFVAPTTWTFTTSASPMVDGWGTWGL